MSPQQVLTTMMTRIVVDKSTDNAKPHLICGKNSIRNNIQINNFRAPLLDLAKSLYYQFVCALSQGVFCSLLLLFYFRVFHFSKVLLSDTFS